MGLAALALGAVVLVFVLAALGGPRGTDAPADPTGSPEDALLYFYAHRVLPSLFHRHPELVELLVEGGADADDSEGPVAATWHELGRRTGAGAGVRPRTSVEDLGDGKAVLVALPSPRQPTHCFFVAAVPGVLGLRYFTLEWAVSERGTVLGEWTRDGAHRNYGEGPAPDKAAFLEAVERALEGE